MPEMERLWANRRQHVPPETSVFSGDEPWKRIMPEWKDQTTLSGGNHITQAQESDEPKSISKHSDDDAPAHLFMYKQYAMTAQPLSKLSPARRLSPADEGFFPTVAVQALMRILKDTSLSNLHGMVMKVCIRSKL